MGPDVRHDVRATATPAATSRYADLVSTPMDTRKSDRHGPRTRDHRPAASRPGRTARRVPAGRRPDPKATGQGRVLRPHDGDPHREGTRPRRRTVLASVRRRGRGRRRATGGLPRPGSCQTSPRSAGTANTTRAGPSARQIAEHERARRSRACVTNDRHCGTGRSPHAFRPARQRLRRNAA